MIRPPPWTDRPRDGTTYLLLPFHFFFTHMLMGAGGRWGGGVGSHRTMPSHSSQRNGPARPPPVLSHPPFLPPPSDSPPQLGSMFAMSISLPNGTVPPSQSQAFCGVGHCVSRVPSALPEEAVGALSLASLLTPGQHCLPQAGSQEACPAPQGASWGARVPPHPHTVLCPFSS